MPVNGEKESLGMPLVLDGALGANIALGSISEVPLGLADRLAT